MIRNLFHYIGLRHLRLRPLRTVLTVLGVGLGIALFAAIGIVNHSTLSSFRESVDAVSGKAEISISSGETGFDERKLEEIAGTPGVRYAVPVIENRAYFTGKGDEAETLMVLGVDLLKEQAVRTYKTTDERIIDDPLMFLNQADSIIVTHAFARAHGLAMESGLTLSTAHGAKRFTVRGLLSPEGPARAYGGAIAIMDIDGARAMFGKEGKLDRVDVVLRDQERYETVAARLGERLGKGFTVERPAARSEAMERMVHSFQIILAMFSSLALVVGVFLVGNTVSMSVAERRREIGVLRAVGATRSGILGLFLTEAALMGTLGSVIGLVLGRGLASVMVGLISRAMTQQFLTRVDVARLQMDGGEIAWALGLGAGASLLAAFWPASRAAGLKPVEAMRGRGGTPARRRSRGVLADRYVEWTGVVLLLFVALTTAGGVPARFPRLDTVNQILAMLGAALVGPWIAIAGIRVLRKLIGPDRALFRLALDNLLRNPRRTGSNVLSLTVGLVLVMIVATVNESARRTIGGWFDRTLQADIVVSSSGNPVSHQTQPLHEELWRKISEVPGVAKAANGLPPALRFLHVPYGGTQIGLKAFDEPDASAGFHSFEIVSGDPERVGRKLYQSAEPTVLATQSFFDRFHKQVGDRIELETPSGNVNFLIIGQVADYASSHGVLYLDRARYKSFWHDPLVTAFGVRVLPGFDPGLVRAEIDRRFGRANNMQALLNSELRREMAKTVDRTFTYAGAIEVVALLVGLLGLLNTLLISVMERTREIGMLRAVGMSRKHVSTMVLLEAVVQGGFGSVVAVALGSALAWLWLTRTLAHVLGWIMVYHFPWMSAAMAVGLGVLVSLIAGIPPSIRAGRIEIREALEYE